MPSPQRCCMTWVMGAAAAAVVGYGAWLVCSQLVYEWQQRERLAVRETTEEVPAALHPAQ